MHEMPSLAVGIDAHASHSGQMPASSPLGQVPLVREAMLPEEGQILTGSQFSEPVRVETVRADGSTGWVLGVVGVNTESTVKNG
jgi:hypothetical protein